MIPEQGLDPEQYHKNLVSLSTTAFEQHFIKTNESDRWVLQGRTSSGQWHTNHLAEICVLRWGTLIVHGDVETVVFSGFSGGSENPIDVLKWMGCTSDLRHYVAKKAVRGLDGDSMIYTKNGSVAVWQLNRCIEDRKSELGDNETPESDPYIQSCDYAIKDLLNDEVPVERVLWGLYESYDPDDESNTSLFDPDEISGLGKVLTPRVYFAHAALKRLISQM